MTAFWPDDQNLLWVPLTVIFAIFIILEILLRPRLAAISVDVMEHADLECMKESAKNCWTNMGVTSALLLTVDVAMLQMGPIESRFEVDHGSQEQMMRLQLSYDLLSGGAMIYCIWALLMCVVMLVYLEPMNNTSAIKFFIANPASIGGPALSIIFACLYTAAALLVWILGTSGIYNCAAIGVFTLVILLVMGFEIRDKSGFDPAGNTDKAKEWQWTTKEAEEWPWFVQKYKKDEKLKRIFRRMGKAIQEAEESTVNDSNAPIASDIIISASPETGVSVMT